jgi:hypothetical protein
VRVRNAVQWHNSRIKFHQNIYTAIYALVGEAVTDSDVTAEQHSPTTRIWASVRLVLPIVGNKNFEF